MHLFVIVWTWGVGDGMCDERRSHICRMEWCNGGVVHSSCQCNYDINATSRRVGDRRPGHPQIGAFGIIIHEAWHSTRGGGMCARGRAQHHGGKGREGRGDPLRRGHKAGAHHQNVGLTLWETPTEASVHCSHTLMPAPCLCAHTPDQHCPGQVDQVLVHRRRGDKAAAAGVDVAPAGRHRLRTSLEPEVLKQHVGGGDGVGAAAGRRRGRAGEQCAGVLGAGEQVLEHQGLHAGCAESGEGGGTEVSSGHGIGVCVEGETGGRACEAH